MKNLIKVNEQTDDIILLGKKRECLFLLC